MEMKAAATCMHWSQQLLVPQTPSSSQALASSIPSPSSSRRRNANALVCHFVHRSALFGRTSSKLLRSISCDIPKSRTPSLRRAVSASSGSFSDEEFAEQIRELALRFHLSEDLTEESGINNEDEQESSSVSFNNGFVPSKIDSSEPTWLRIRPVPPYEILPANIEQRANSVDLPFSLRLIKKKNQLTEDFREAGGSAYTSVKKAFSSMVFIIRELHSYTLQMREYLFLEDVQGILDRVQKEMHASFVWLFSQIFSHTPTLMMYVMILMANFTVYSMSNNAAIASPPPVQCHSTITEAVASMERQNPLLDLSQVKTFPDSGKEISIGGNNGGSGKVKAIGSGTNGGDGRFNGVSSFHRIDNIVPDEVSQLTSFGNPTTSKKEQSNSNQHVSINEEIHLWNSMVQAASKMQAALMDESLDHDTMQRFVSPIFAQIEPDGDYIDYARTGLKYQEAISQEPNNPLLLTNYAQFLYLVVHDHDRAEAFFKRASDAKPTDSEALSKYANFLWMVRKDISAAEETYLGAIEADSSNTYHASNYAHFLWNTGGEDTCYPLP